MILVSIHANAFGNGREWTKARGGQSIRAKDKPEQTFSLMI